MGIFAGLKLANAVANDYTATPAHVVSPWSDTSTLMPALAIDQLLGLNAPELVTRSMALKVPAVAKGRAILHAIIAKTPLRAYRGDTALDPQPGWLTRTDSGISPEMRVRLILDDLLFNEASLLAVKRGFDNQILDAVPVPYNEWAVNAEGLIEIRGTIVPADQVIYIPGPGPGLLEQAAEHIQAARSTDRAWASRVRNPFPAMILRETDDNGLTQKEAQQYVASIRAARRDPDNAVAFLPYDIEVQAHQSDPTDLFESGRNALRLDFANFMNIPAAMLDGSVSTASLTYSTQEGRRNELFDYTIGYWAGPIEEALSLDNAVPRGQRVRFDFANYLTPTPAPTGPITED